MKTIFKLAMLPVMLVLSVRTPPAFAADADAKGFWLTNDGTAMVEFKGCPDAPAALCGRIVSSGDAGQPNSVCNVEIARLGLYSDGAWRDGWTVDPRSNKKYKATLRVAHGELYIHAEMDAELFGLDKWTKRLSKSPESPKTSPRWIWVRRMHRPQKSLALPRCK